MALRSPESFEVHEFARFFPPLERSDFESLKRSIETHGLLQPITMFEDKLIDGIHRLRALSELGRMVDDECDMVELDTLDGKPLHEVIWSLNGHRRHMGPSLKAAIYVKLFGEVARREAENRKAKGGEKGRESQKTSGNPLVANLPPANSDDRIKARDEIAKLADVSPRTVQAAMTVKAKDPVLFDDIVAGKVTASAAARQVLDKEKPTPEPKPKEDKPDKKTDEAVDAFIEAWHALKDKKAGMRALLAVMGFKEVIRVRDLCLRSLSHR